MSYPVRRSPFRMGWDPFGELQSLREEMSRIFGSALLGTRAGVPDVDLDEDEDGWTVTARLPGVAPEEVSVEVDDRELSIRTHAEGEAGGAERAAAERRRSFDYRFSMPGDVDVQRVAANMDNGLLTVRLPRTERSKRRAIAVGHKAIEGSTAEGRTGGGTPGA